MLTFGSLFAGIGGFDLGFERAGLQCKWQVEIDPYCRAVLAKHWPNVARHDDICTFATHTHTDLAVDVICGGFPCQDISLANHEGQGLSGSRSGLWYEYERVIRALRPRYVAIENVAAILYRGLDRVLWSLASCGYDAEWQVVPASGIGAPHRRDRLFIVAYANGKRCHKNEVFARDVGEDSASPEEQRQRNWPGLRLHCPALPDRIRWCPDGELCRMVDGIPDELHRYKQLGNSIVPQVAEFIGRRIIANA